MPINSIIYALLQLMMRSESKAMKNKTWLRIFLLSIIGLLSISCYKSWVTLTPNTPVTPALPTATHQNTPTGTPTPIPTHTLTPTPEFDRARLGTVEHDIVYCSVDGVDLKMDVYYPEIWQPSWAAIIEVHGGGWVTGSKSEAADNPDREALTQAGFLFASINYRLAPEYKFPVMIEDAKCAVRFLRANASEFNIDPEKIGAMGASSGGHLVSLLGLTSQSAGWDVGQYLDQSSQVQAVVDYYGPADLTDHLLSNTSELHELEQVFGVTSRSDPVMAKASPVTYITVDAPPFLIVQGEQDAVVLPDQSQEFYDRLNAEGIPVKLVLVKNAGHGLVPTGGDISPSRQEITRMVVDFFVEYLK